MMVIIIKKKIIRQGYSLTFHIVKLQFSTYNRKQKERPIYSPFLRHYSRLSKSCLIVGWKLSETEERDRERLILAMYIIAKCCLASNSHRQKKAH